MSPDLARALHDAVDTGPDDQPFDVSSIAGRIRRRRTVRAGVRGGVAVGAAGAVALGAVFVAARPALSVLPAARAGAAPGACGSDIDLLPRADEPAVGLVPSTDGTWDLPEPGIPTSRTDLGPLVGRWLTPLLASRLTPEARTAAIEARTRAALAELADAQARRDSEAGRGPVDALDLAVAAAEQEVEDAGALPPVFEAADTLHSELLVTHGTTVVAADTDPSIEAGSYALSSAVDETIALTILSSELTTCATSGEPGGVPLPAGEYGVYVSYDPGDGRRTVAGPWPLTLLTSSPAPTDLPDGFPVEEVPLIGGRLLSATPMGLSSGSGWGLEIAVDGADAAAEAVRLLSDDVPMPSSISTSSEGYYAVGAWEVRVAASESVDGEPTVVYTVRPTS